jgi:Ca2+-binding RTX toxin-like protein
VGAGSDCVKFSRLLSVSGKAWVAIGIRAGEFEWGFGGILLGHASFAQLFFGVVTIRVAIPVKNGLNTLLRNRTEMTTLTVTTLSDDAGHSGMSLRDALAIANSGAGSDNIVFASGLSGTITLQQGQLTISSGVTIDGDNTGDSVSDITISGNSSSRVFNVLAGTSTLKSLTLRDGVSTLGGAVLVASGASLTIDYSTITSNQTIAGAAEASRGGGIANLGTLILKNSTVEQNTAYDHGGGVFSRGNFTATNSTFSDNSAGSSAGGILSDAGLFTASNITVSGNSSMLGGGIVNESAMVAHNITVSLNNGGSYGAGVFNTGSLSISNSIVLGNGPGSVEAEVFGAINATGVNIIGAGLDANASDGRINARSVEAVFGSNGLADNGGPVDTIMLAASSNPAIDAASGGGIPTTDARGHLRVGNADLGAVEWDNGPLPDPTPDPTPTPEPDPAPDPDPTPVPDPVITPDPIPTPEPVVLNVIKGNAWQDTLSGTAGKDVIYTYEGDDLVQGRDGDDRIYGSYGDDRLYGNNGDDRIVGGKGNDGLAGGSGSDWLSGQSGNDRIHGGSGDDNLAGGSGYDRFYFDNLTSRDTISDFDVRYDRILISDEVFKGLDTGVLSVSRFAKGAFASDVTDRIIYNAETGDLSFDSDGNRAGEAVTFATLKPWLHLTAADFFVY